MMTKSLTNATVTILLLLILLAVYTMPRFNYEKLASDLGSLHSRQASVEAKVATLDRLFGSESKRTAFVSTLESLSSLVEVFQSDSYTVFEEIGELRDAIREQKGEFERLRRDCAEGSAAEEVGGATESTEIEYTEAREAAEKISSRKASEWDFGRLLDQIVELGWGGYDHYSEIPEALVEDLALAFSIYKMNVELIAHQKRVTLAEWLDDANESGDFIDVPVNDVEGLREHGALRTQGLLHITTLPGGNAKRFYVFDVQDYPELLRFNELQDGAKSRLLNQVYGVLSDRE